MARRRMTRLERLDRRGIVAFELDGLLVRGRKQDSAAAFAAARDGILAQTIPLAQEISARVFGRGVLANGDRREVDGNRSVYTSQQYADRASAAGRVRKYFIQGGTVISPLLADMLRAKGVRPQVVPQAAFKSAQELHQIAGGVFGRVTGGLRDGMQVRVAGKQKAIIDFIGSSEGVGRIKPFPGVRYPSGGQFRVRVPQRVQNRQKAGAIYSTTGVNILEPSQAELAALTDRVMVRMQDALAVVFQ